ncbi:MAG TPA: MnhB domain-containing protein, partial [Ktedonobacterales bacterium]
LCLFLTAPAFVLGWYIVSHGQLTPGGGFQGGTVLASALLLIYLSGGYKTFHKLGAEPRSEVPEALGAGGFVVIGLAGLLAGAAFLQNIIPLGPVGLVYSGGTIPLISLSVGVEVGGGFLVILAEFLRQALQVRERARARERGQEQQ